jgi:hypothetical protein
MSLLVIEMMKINFILKASDLSFSALAKWILSFCLNIHDLSLNIQLKKLNCLHNEIARLKKLKKLDVKADGASDLTEVTSIALSITTTLLIYSKVVRSCRQVETLRMNLIALILRELAELEPAENMTDITLYWETGPSIEDALPFLKRWRHLNRLTFIDKVQTRISVPPLEVLGDFILGMKQLTHLHIFPKYDLSNSGQLKVLRDEINELILPRRPNFTFSISLVYYLI